MYNTIKISVLSICALLLMPSMAIAKNKTLFNCPNIEELSKNADIPLTQGYDGWFFRKADVKGDYPVSNETANYFGRLGKTLKQHQIELFFVPLISRSIIASDYINPTAPYQQNFNINQAIASYKKMVAKMRSQSIYVPNLIEDMDEYIMNGMHSLSFKRDIHWHPRGAAKIAEHVANDIKKMPLYNSLKKSSFISRETEKEIVLAGGFYNEVMKYCQDSIAPERYKAHETILEVDKNADALFGDNDEIAPISLVGSSFSAVQEFDFSGFLAKEIGVDVTNHAIPSGQLFKSIISYFSSKGFQKDKPKILIWESQSIYDFNQNIENNFRQIIPAIAGECAGENKILSTNTHINIDKTNQELFSVDKEKGISGANYYLFLKSKNVNFNNFVISIEYDDGDGERFAVNRSEVYKNEGIFFIELSDKIKNNLISIGINNLSRIPTDLSASLCYQKL